MGSAITRKKNLVSGNSLDRRLRNTLVHAMLMDWELYSESNWKLFFQNGNSYIIQVASHVNSFKEIMAQVKYTSSFDYRSGEKCSLRPVF